MSEGRQAAVSHEFLWHPSLTFALLCLRFAERRGWRWLRFGGWWGCGRGAGPVGHHAFHSGGHVGSCQSGGGGGRASQGVVGAELAPLGAQHHHHLGHGNFGVLGGYEGPVEGEVAYRLSQNGESKK